MINDKTKEILSALTHKYAPPAYGFLREVRNGTGYLRSTRTCDGLAMSLYPSRGLELTGFEIKTIRSDWLKELNDPSKADEFVNFCDKWYLAVSDETIVKPGELPMGWGLMVLKGKYLRVAVVAEQRKPDPIDRLFLASIFRDFTEGTIPRDALDQMVKESLDATIETLKKRWENEYNFDARQAQDELERNQKAIKEFEEASGIKFDRWSMGKIGRAVKLIIANEDIDWIERRLKGLRDDAKGIYENIDKVLSEPAS